MNPPVAANSPPVEIDLLIRPEWIIPIEPAGVTLTGHALAVDKGRILSLLPDSDARPDDRPRQPLDLPAQVLLRGLANLHVELVGK